MDSYGGGMFFLVGDFVVNSRLVDPFAESPQFPCYRELMHTIELWLIYYVFIENTLVKV